MNISKKLGLTLCRGRARHVLRLRQGRAEEGRGPEGPGRRQRHRQDRPRRPADRRHRAPRQGRRERRAPRGRRAHRPQDEDRRQDRQVRADERGRPGRSEDRPDDRAEVRRREGRRRRRSPELRRLDPGVGDLQPGRHPDDLGLGDEPEADRAGLQDHLPHGRPRRPAGPGHRAVPRRAEGQEDRDRRRRDRVRRRPRERSREDAEGGGRPGRGAREDHRQDDRLQGDPDQDQGQGPRRRVLRRHGRHRRPDDQAGARARHQGGVRVRRRRVHRRDGQARRRGGRRADLLAGGPAGFGGEQAVQRRVQGEVRRGQAVRAVLLRRRRPHDRRDAEGRLGRSGQVPARAARRSATTAPPARSSSTRRATARTPRSRSSR